MSRPELLVGDRFQAECKEPKVNKKKDEVILKRKASCRITRQTDQEELEIIRMKLESWEINPRNNISHPKELICNQCCCSTKDFHKWHTGQDKVRPFTIDRIDSSPAMCSMPLFGEAEPYAIRDIIVENL